MAWAEGRAMTVEQAIAEALDEAEHSVTHNTERDGRKAQ
jgi:hypothetical protein